MKNKMNPFTIFAISLISIIVFLLSPFSTPLFRYLTSVSADEKDVVYVDSIVYEEIITYLNNTIWENATEYIPYWINTTLYINSTHG